VLNGIGVEVAVGEGVSVAVAVAVYVAVGSGVSVGGDVAVGVAAGNAAPEQAVSAVVSRTKVMIRFLRIVISPQIVHLLRE
jgi:hypothetical protein